MKLRSEAIKNEECGNLKFNFNLATKLMKSVLITRPKNSAQELLQSLENKGYFAFVEPLFSVKKIAATPQNSAQISGIIITSANACDALLNFGFSRDVKIFSVGQKTAQKLLDAGFKNIDFAPENSAASLRDLIVKTHHDKSQKLIYFCGSKITLDFKSELENKGFKVEKILAYQTQEVQKFSDQFLQITHKISFDKVLIFSQNSGKIFHKLAKQHNLLEYFAASQILCLSEKILLQMKNFGFNNCAIFKDFL